MTHKSTIETFLDTDEDSDNIDDPPPLQNSNHNTLYIVHIGPFSLSTSEVTLRKSVFINKAIIPTDITIQIRNNAVFGFIAYKTLSDAQQIVFKFNNITHKTINICQLIETEHNKYSKALYDRSSFSNKTQWIQLFGLKTTHNMENKKAKNWIKRLLNWEFTEKHFEILNIKIVHNVRYSVMNGFALIELENNDITQQLVTYFQQKWIDDNDFQYWIDYVDETRNVFINSETSDVFTKQLIFNNLNWKTNKSVLRTHIESLMGNDFNVEIVNIAVNATANGYPLGTAIVSLKNINDAKLVQNVCHGTELLDESISVDFYKEKECSVPKKVIVNVDNDVESDSDMESEEELDSDSDIYTDSDDMTDSDDDIKSDDVESLSEDEFDDDRMKQKKRFPLKDKDILGLWKWNNPHKRCPSGLLSHSRHIGAYRKDWKQLKRKDWLQEWNKKERIAGKDKYWIRSGKLIPASKRWRDRYKKKTRK